MVFCLPTKRLPCRVSATVFLRERGGMECSQRVAGVHSLLPWWACTLPRQKSDQDLRSRWTATGLLEEPCCQLEGRPDKVDVKRHRSPTDLLLLGVGYPLSSVCGSVGKLLIERYRGNSGFASVFWWDYPMQGIMWHSAHFIVFFFLNLFLFCTVNGLLDHLHKRPGGG